MRSTSIIVLAAVAVVIGAVYLWSRYRRIKRDRDAWATLARLGQETNYRLACTVHGKTAVDSAIRKANEKGRN